jgi:glycosyltransferase involved in cell wall biosynthesis
MLVGVNLFNMQKKVLIISRDFIPYCRSLGGVIRVLKMAEFFHNNDICVYILAAKGEKINYFGYENLIKNIKVIYIEDPLQNYVTKNINRMSLITAEDTNLITKIQTGVKNFINEISIPDAGVFFTRNTLMKALELISEKDIKNIIVSSPPHSSQLVGLKIKKKLGSDISYIVDYRDSWNLTRLFSKNTYLPNKLNEKYEKDVLKKCDYFLYVSFPMLQKINFKYFDITSKSLLVMNGFDIKMANNNIVYDKNDILTIGYFGSTSVHHNPENLFKVVKKLNKQIKLIFYGHTLVGSDWMYKMDGILEVKGNLEHKKALNMMRKMDILMIIYSEVDGADEVITGKLFDYMLAEKPIFVVGPKNMEAARLVKDRQLGYYADIYNEKDILHTLNCIYKDWQNDELISYSLNNVKDFSRQNQYKKILDILK